MLKQGKYWGNMECTLYLVHEVHRVHPVPDAPGKSLVLNPLNKTMFQE